MSLWVWLTLGLVVRITLLLAPFLQREAALAQQARELRLRYLGSTFVIAMQRRQWSWWLFK